MESDSRDEMPGDILVWDTFGIGCRSDMPPGIVSWKSKRVFSEYRQILPRGQYSNRSGYKRTQTDQRQKRISLKGTGYSARDILTR